MSDPQSRTTGISLTSVGVGVVPLCGFCGRPIASNPAWLGAIPYHFACTQPPAAAVPLGCICPPGAEATCQGLSCPRRGWKIT